LSGSPQGAGGVGGLLFVSEISNGLVSNSHLPCLDANGNVSALVKASDGSVSANYEYGPFGEALRATGPMARTNPFRFSTKLQDDETDRLYYGYRYLNTSLGRWLSRDPYEESGTENLYTALHNNPESHVDLFGLDDSDLIFKAFRSIRDDFAGSEAAATTGYRQTFRTFLSVLPKIKVTIGYPGNGATAAYYPFWNKMVLRPQPNKFTVVHEMVHAWMDHNFTGIDGDRRDEGMAYALEQGMESAAFGISVLEHNLLNGDQGHICDPEYLKTVWRNYWETRARPEQYPGGKLSYYPWTQFKLDRLDFMFVHDTLHFNIKCDKFAKVLNGILESKGCCCRFTCANTDTDPTHITPGQEIDFVFRSEL
jgi:RHS repeat-associated protein